MRFFNRNKSSQKNIRPVPPQPIPPFFDIPTEVRIKVDLTEFERSMMALLGNKGFSPLVSITYRYNLYSTAVFGEQIVRQSSWDNNTQEIVLSIMVEEVSNARMTNSKFYTDIDHHVSYYREVIQQNAAFCAMLKTLMPLITS